MEVTRVIHPIGQGGFCTESFDDQHVVVYDCGGNDTKSMENYIDSLSPEFSNKTIEAVFISHLHEDHINGLQHLIDKTNVRRIFLPLLTKDKVFEALFYNAVRRTGNRVNSFIVLLVDTIRSAERKIIGDTHLTMVTEEYVGEHIQYSIDESIPDIIASGSYMVYDSQWVYIPYNSKTQRPIFRNIINKEHRAILKQIYNEESVSQQAQSIAEFVKQNTIQTCVEIYKLLYGGIHNSQSMPVFSGLLQKKDVYMRSLIEDSSCFLDCQTEHNCRFHYNNHTDYCYDNCDFCIRYNCNLYHFLSPNTIICNFLYTGDYEAKEDKNMNQMKRFYNRHKVWMSICGVQIPHHGSKYNYNRQMYEHCYYAVASAGLNNKFGHPHPETLLHISQQKCLSIVVTEKHTSKFIQHIQF